MMARAKQDRTASSLVSRTFLSAAGRTCAPRAPHSSRRDAHAFTLIEIMVAVGIIAVILAIGIPTLFREAHQDSMRHAVKSIREVFSEARARAVLDGSTAELKFRPGDRTITVVPNSSRAENSGGFTSLSDMRRGDDAPSGAKASGGLPSQIKISDHIIIDFLGINLVPDLQSLEEVSAFFYPDGTADEIVLLIRSDLGEVRKITTEVVTGIADVEVVK